MEKIYCWNCNKPNPPDTDYERLVRDVGREIADLRVADGSLDEHGNYKEPTYTEGYVPYCQRGPGYGELMREDMNTEPTLQLLVLDLRDTCVVVVEKGQIAIAIKGKRYFCSYASRLPLLVESTFAELQETLSTSDVPDESAPPVRIERLPPDSAREYKLVLPDDNQLVYPERSIGITWDDLQGLSQWFGGKVMDDLPIYEPKRTGKWVLHDADPSFTDIRVWRYTRYQ